MKLLIISGTRSIAEKKSGAFFDNLKEHSKYWDRIDIIVPKTKQKIFELYGNVFIHSSNKPLVLHPLFIKEKGEELFYKEKFNVVTVHEYPPFYNGLGAYLLYKKIKVPYVLEVHHIVGIPRAANLKEKLYCFLFRKLAKLDSKNSIAVRVTNRSTCEILSGWGVQPEKIKIIPSFYIDTKLFKPGAGEKKYDIVTAGRLDSNKGFDLLIKAVKILKKRMPAIKVVIIGDGPLKDGLMGLSRKLGLENNIVFAGWQQDISQVSELYNQSRVFVLTSFNEGGPRTALEAMSCNLPIVSTRVGLIPELIIDGDNGFFIDWSPEDIADKIGRVLFDTTLEKRFSSGNREKVAKFDKGPTAENYARELLNIARQSRG